MPDGYRFRATAGPNWSFDFCITYTENQTGLIAALSADGITDPTLLAAAQNALDQFTRAATVIGQIDAALVRELEDRAGGLVSELFSNLDSPTQRQQVDEFSPQVASYPYNLLHRRTRGTVAADTLSARTGELWARIMKRFISRARNTTLLLPGVMSAFSDAIDAAPDSDSKTAAEALLASMTPIRDGLLGVGYDPLNREGSPFPFAIGCLPQLSVQRVTP
jgi:hypothetical protein